MLQTKTFKDNKFKFKIKKNQILQENDYCYFLGYANDFYKLFNEYGWGLFDLNVRSELRNSSINEKIVESLTIEKK